MNMSTKELIDQLIERKRDIYISASDQIWNFSEIRFKEIQSAETLISILKKENFSIEQGIVGMDAAFIGSFGQEGPIIAFLGEYDALSGLSQQDGIAEKKELIAGANGHGCGHNLLGVGALAAAIAMKDYLIETGKKGIVRYYGCPAEEGGSGKAFMVREGVFADVDIALSWLIIQFGRCLL